MVVSGRATASRDEASGYRLINGDTSASTIYAWWEDQPNLEPLIRELSFAKQKTCGTGQLFMANSHVRELNDDDHRRLEEWADSLRA